MVYLSVFIGGGIGSLLRFWISSLGVLPYATFFINVLGSFILGFLAFFFMDKADISPVLRFGLMAGFCGGFTTFSTFSVEVFAMLQENHYWEAGGYVLASIFISLAAVYLGFLLARAL